MTVDNAAFRRDIARILHKRRDQIPTLARAAGMWLLNNLTERSPVGNPSLWKHPAPPGYVGGRFKANWNVGVGAIDYDISKAPDASGGTSIKAGAERFDAWSGFGVIHITNSLPYSKRIEYESWSTQAPAGVVRITVVDFKNMVRTLAQQVKANA